MMDKVVLENENLCCPMKLLWGQGEFRNFFSWWRWKGNGSSQLLGSSCLNTTLCVCPGIISWRPDRLSGFSLSHCLQIRARGGIKPQGVSREWQLLPVPQAGTGQGKGSWVQPHQAPRSNLSWISEQIILNFTAWDGSNTSKAWPRYPGAGEEATRLEKGEEWKVCSLYKGISSL